jgi:outer membrane protein assembly factor BamA
VDPAEHQIVKYTFDNVWLDFLPGAWLVRIDDLRASMTMGQPFPGVWLPRDMAIHAGLTLAAGSFEAGYSRDFSDYREADVKTTIRIPKSPQPEAEAPEDVRDEHASMAHGPFVASSASTLVFEDSPPQMGQAPAPGTVAREPGQEVIREVRVHGNAFLSDEDVLTLAGITIGEGVAQDVVDLITIRLKDSGRFETVDVRKRYRSLTDPTDVALVLIVHERPGITTMADTDHPILRPVRRLKDGLMFLPIVSFADGYGFTYGGRVSAMNTLGLGERLSVPLTWGGTKRAALEFDRTFDRGPLTRITSSAAIWKRTNPRFDLDDRRVEFKAGLERQFAQIVRLGADASRASVSFGELDDRLWTIGATAALDTRGNPAFPSNALYVGGGWNALHVRGLERINRYTADGRGYLRVVGQAVLAGRALYANSDAPLPPYERLLLGGSSTLRGFRTGAFDGDRMLVTSAELRVPITSVISGARLGVTLFMDAAKTVDFGHSFDSVDWRRGVGGGVFLMAPLFKINLDVARGLDGGGTRVHLGTGFGF